MTRHGWNLIGAGVKYQQINQYYFIDTGFAECTVINTQDTCVPCSNGFYLIGQYETSNFPDPNVCAAIKECSPGKYHTITDICRGESELVLNSIIFPENNTREEYEYIFIFPEPAWYKCFIIRNETKKAHTGKILLTSIF